MTQHLKDYLAYYQTCNSPGYAVLVTGAWGTGKTFQVKAAVPETSRFYVSLFGLQSPQDVHAAVAAAMDPTLTGVKKLLSIGSGFGNQAPGLWKFTGTGTALVNSLIKTRADTNKTIIFDDLERSSLSLPDLSGVINQYVEHLGCRVIVIAHEEKLAREFKDSKEKIFGQVLLAEMQIEDAFEAFCQGQESHARRLFMKEFRDEILFTFQESGCPSLRILKHVMTDLGRLFDALTSDQHNHKKAIADVIGLFVAFDIEVRNGLDTAELVDRRGRVLRFSMGTKEDVDPPAISALDKKYSTVDLTSELLTDQVLLDIFKKGLFDTASIRKSLDQSVYFAKPATLPAWQRVINFDDLEDDVVNAAVAEMDRDFASRRYTNPGELLHVFALKLMMAHHGIVAASLGDVVVDCQAYLDDIVKIGTLVPRENDWRWDTMYRQSHNGIRYWIEPAFAAQFQDLWDGLNHAREIALVQNIDAIIADIMRLVQTNGLELYEKLNETAKGAGPYAYLPILHHIDVKAFLNAWLSAPKSDWRYVTRALGTRYSRIPNGIGLNGELAWFQDLATAMGERADKLPGFEGVRLKRAIPRAE